MIKEFGWFLIFIGIMGVMKASYLLFISNSDASILGLFGIFNLLGGIMYIRKNNE